MLESTLFKTGLSYHGSFAHVVDTFALQGLERRGLSFLASSLFCYEFFRIGRLWNRMVLVVNCTKFLEELDILILLQFLFRDVITAQVEKNVSQQLRIFLCERDGQIFIEQNLRRLQLRRVDRFIVIIVRLIPELVGGLRRPLVSRLAEDARPLAINIDAAVLVDGWPTFLTDIFFGDL